MRIGTLKQSYIADAALFDSRTQKVWLAIGAALLVLFPFIASDYWLYLACLVAINVASATGLNILTGYTGLVSLGQAAFMGLGAYTVAILQARWGTPFLLNIFAGGLVAMVGGIVVGIPSLRVKGLYLAIATIAASFIAHFLFANLKFTGGTTGLSLKPATVFGLSVLVVVIVGGLDSVLGALVGGLLIGLIEALAGAYLGGEYKLLATFIVLVFVLMIRPYGLFGTHEIERL